MGTALLTCTTKDKHDGFLNDAEGLCGLPSGVFVSSLRRKGSNCANLDSSITQYKWNLRVKVLELQADKDFPNVSLVTEMRLLFDILIIIPVNEKWRKDAVRVYLEWLLSSRVAFIVSKWYMLIFLPFNPDVIEKSDPPMLTYARNPLKPSEPGMFISGDVRHHLKPPGPLLIFTYGRHHQSHQNH